MKYSLKYLLEGVLDSEEFWSSEDNNWHIGAGVFYMYDPSSKMLSDPDAWDEEGFSKYLYGHKRGMIHGKVSHSLKHAGEFMPKNKGQKWTSQPTGVPTMVLDDVKAQVVETLRTLGHTEVFVQKKPRKNVANYPIVKMSIDDPDFLDYIFCGLDWIHDRIRKGWNVSNDEKEVMLAGSVITENYEKELDKFLKDNADAKDVSDKNFPDIEKLLEYLQECFDTNKAIRFKIKRTSDQSKLFEVLYSLSDTTYTSVELGSGKRGTFMRMEGDHHRRTFWRALLRFSPVSARETSKGHITFNGNQLLIGYQNFAEICQAARERFEDTIFAQGADKKPKSDWGIGNKYKRNKGKWTPTGARTPEGEQLMVASFQRLLREKRRPTKKKLPAVLDDSITGITNIINNTPIQHYGYNVLSTTLEEDSAADIVYTVILQHIKPDFGKYVDELISKGGKFAQIYSDTPRSKTQLTRWLTGFKSDPDHRQKSAAIKVAQVAGLDCLNNTIVQRIEMIYDCTVVVNFTGAKTQKKGQSIFELFVFDHGQGPMTPLEDGEGIPETPIPPKAPKDIVVDDGVVEIPVQPVPPKPKKKKSRKRKKKLKLTRDQKKAGYNQINQEDGSVRHVLPLQELEEITDHIVDMVVGNATKKVQMSRGILPEKYTELKNKSHYSAHKHNATSQVFRVVDDYYKEDLPLLNMHKGYVIYGGEINSRSIMSQYTSFGSSKEERFAIDKEGKFTPPKLGGKEAKDARRYVQGTRSNDELIIYAEITPKRNKWTKAISKHTGKITLYVFLLNRNYEG